MTTCVGRVRALRRHPVKSMLGKPLSRVGVTERGRDGDRRFALLDSGTGKVASAKNPRLWRRLLTLSAATTDSGVRITAPAARSSAPRPVRPPRTGQPSTGPHVTR